LLFGIWIGKIDGCNTGDPKKRELLKNPKKFEEIQQKKIY
jgi:hypothetical protein